jgi:short-subunit dehydrogenase
MSESLRIELEPLGVKCLHVTTSFVETSWFRNVPVFRLPEDSYYKPVSAKIERAAQGHGYKTMPAAVYADRVVSDVLAGKEGIVQRGYMASIINWGMIFLPRWFMVGIQKSYLTPYST